MLGLAPRRVLRVLHDLRESDPVPLELRGWSWDRPPVRPRARLGLGVSEIAYGSRCGWRSMWLRRRRGVTLEVSNAAALGQMVHEVFHAAASDVVKLVFARKPWDISKLLDSAHKRFPREVVELYKALVVSMAGEATNALLTEGGLGAGVFWLTEYRVDGWPLGLSRHLRVDALGDSGVIVEVKLGKRARWQRLSLAGYALALECTNETPVDYGVLVNVVLNGGVRVDYEPVYISPDLRREFLEYRDEAIDVLLSDEEPPETQCLGDED